MEDLRPKIKNVIRFIIVVCVISLLITTICLLMLKYAVEGENNMPFELSQLIVVSTAEGIDREEAENTWNFDLVQNNDVYIRISKNKNYEETEIIKNITIDNIKIEEGPKLGKIVIYRPSSEESKMYEYKEEHIINDQIIYTGSEAGNAKNLEIPNQGGIIMFRLCNNEIGKYSSNEEMISHDGTILSKAGIEYEKIKYKVSFDIGMELASGIKFTGKIKLDMPSGNIVTEGISKYEKTEFKDVIFKRN